MEKEIWKDIPNYEGYYKASNLGRVKSLDKLMNNQFGTLTPRKGRVIGGEPNKDGYIKVNITVNGKRKIYAVHQLVAMAFLSHKPDGMNIVVDHIDNNPLNNKLDNLQLITQRENVSKEVRGSSKYTGVCWDKANNKWRASITIRKKLTCLGRYTSEEDASNAYLKKLKELEDKGYATSKNYINKLKGL